MKDKIHFRENPYQPQMDRIWINDRCAKTDMPRWAFEELPEDKKQMVYNTLKQMYNLGFERGQQNKIVEISEAIDALKYILK